MRGCLVGFLVKVGPPSKEIGGLSLLSLKGDVTTTSVNALPPGANWASVTGRSRGTITVRRRHIRGGSQAFQQLASTYLGFGGNSAQGPNAKYTFDFIILSLIFASVSTTAC